MDIIDEHVNEMTRSGKKPDFKRMAEETGHTYNQTRRAFWRHAKDLSKTDEKVAAAYSHRKDAKKEAKPKNKLMEEMTFLKKQIKTMKRDLGKIRKMLKGDDAMSQTTQRTPRSNQTSQPSTPRSTTPAPKNTERDSRSRQTSPTRRQ